MAMNGTQILLKSLGIDFNPEDVKRVVESVSSIAENLKAISEKQDEILILLRKAQYGSTTDNGERGGPGYSRGSGPGSGGHGTGSGDCRERSPGCPGGIGDS